MMPNDPSLRGDGVLEWHDEQGRPHNDGAPARVFPSGREEWFRHGKLHREGGPAAIYSDGRRIWFQDGVKVREERTG